MRNVLAAIVASTFVFGAAAGIAADSAKKEELTQEQRAEMRSRADRLIQERAKAPQTVKADKHGAPKAKTPHVKKAKKVSTHGAKKATPKA